MIHPEPDPFGNSPDSPYYQSPESLRYWGPIGLNYWLAPVTQREADDALPPMAVIPWSDALLLTPQERADLFGGEPSGPELPTVREAMAIERIRYATRVYSIPFDAPKGDQFGTISAGQVLSEVNWRDPDDVPVPNGLYDAIREFARRCKDSPPPVYSIPRPSPRIPARARSLRRASYRASTMRNERA